MSAGWLALSREHEDAADQDWAFCSRECTWSWLTNPLPEPEHDPAD